MPSHDCRIAARGGTLQLPGTSTEIDTDHPFRHDRRPDVPREVHLRWARRARVRQGAHAVLRGGVARQVEIYNAPDVREGVSVSGAVPVVPLGFL